MPGSFVSLRWSVSSRTCCRTKSQISRRTFITVNKSIVCDHRSWSGSSNSDVRISLLLSNGHHGKQTLLDYKHTHTYTHLVCESQNKWKTCHLYIWRESWYIKTKDENKVSGTRNASLPKENIDHVIKCMSCDFASVAGATLHSCFPSAAFMSHAVCQLLKRLCVFIFNSPAK